MWFCLFTGCADLVQCEAFLTSHLLGYIEAKPSFACMTELWGSTYTEALNRGHFSIQDSQLGPNGVHYREVSL